MKLPAPQGVDEAAGRPGDGGQRRTGRPSRRRRRIWSGGWTSAPVAPASSPGCSIRKVPKGTNWFYTLGSATLFAFTVQAVTGVFLAMFYTPSPTQAYSSISHLTNDVFLGEFVRGMHKWGASVMIILVFLHMARTFVFGAYKYPRELNWVIGVVLLILTMIMGFTGYLLPFDQRSFWATIGRQQHQRHRPFVGPYLADFLYAGPEFGATTLSRFYAIHMLIVPGPDHRPDRSAPVPRGQARDDGAAVARAEAKPSRGGDGRQGRSEGASMNRGREGGLPPRLRAAEEAGQAVLPVRGDEGLDDGPDRRRS